jgi:DNA ligase-1
MMIYKIFQELLSDGGRLHKEAILRREQNNELLKRVCYLALNPYIRFHVHKYPKKFAGGNTMTLNFALSALSQLSDRKITGNNAIIYLENLFNSLTVEDAEVLKKVIDKDLKCGVSTSTVNKIWPDLVPEFLIQFASSYDENKIPQNNFALEPKYDGHRAVVICDLMGEVTFFTRGGREYETLDRFKDDVKKLVGRDRNFMLDAEVIAGNFEETGSAVKRKGKNAKEDVEIFLFVFDFMDYTEFNNKYCPHTYGDRRKVLEFLFAENNTSEFLRLGVLDHYDATTGETPKAFIQRIFKEKRGKLIPGTGSRIEGLIAKTLDGLYEFDRTLAWMKVKPLETADVRIKGYYEGTGKYVGMLGGFEIEVDGVDARCGGGFSDKQRKEFWEVRTEMIDDIIEVEFMEKTAKGKTRHCNFICSRTFKGQKI